MPKSVKITILSLLLSILYGCVNENDLDPPAEVEGPLSAFDIPSDFDFSTSRSVTVSLDVPEFLDNAVFTLYGKKGNQDSLAFAKANFDDNGHFEKQFQLGVETDSVLISTNYLGLTPLIRLPIINNSISFDYNTLYDRNNPVSSKLRSIALKAKNNKPPGDIDFEFLSGHSSNGVPDIMETPDVITQELLDDINASLPENQNVKDLHPEYLDNKETNLVITEEADVWVTFVAESAVWKNTLGFYTFPVGLAPASPDDITAHTVIFPNASMNGDGGGLFPGDKVHLGRFPANTVVSWFVVSNGWKGNKVGKGQHTYYSEETFNTDNNNKSQMVLLNDPSRNLAVLGIEDGPRNGDDGDFNDSLFYITSNPVGAVQVLDFATLDVANDADVDGVDNTLDDFPFDFNLAFNNFAPSINSSGKMVFEDLWPHIGDYDFNDLAMDYNFNLMANADNMVTKIQATFTIESIGGHLENGFAFTFPMAPSSISSITGQVLNADYISVDANGTETGTATNETVVFVIGNVIGRQGETINMEITFANPVSVDALGEVPFNAFLIADGIRGKEIHLPDLPPTSKAMFLGSADDFSNPSNDRYYKTNMNLPWALNIYEGFVPPRETVSISEEYPDFVNWANSGGTQNLDWYVK
ncbi:LruC domain-containing protein [Flagellimonas sp. S3867]|uniref:LruC domain-containing protein n=1 Tax=Flagellimonas sp. S3867 TaxID=2768063 RepID=UPI0016854192|nr:LruC domain-containing protein [Flagellimonas sp. S3867]